MQSTGPAPVMTVHLAVLIGGRSLADLWPVAAEAARVRCEESQDPAESSVASHAVENWLWSGGGVPGDGPGPHIAGWDHRTVNTANRIKPAVL